MIVETLKKSLRAVAMIACSFCAIVASAGAFSTENVIYIVAGIGNLVCTGLGIYKTIKNNK